MVLFWIVVACLMSGIAAENSPQASRDRTLLTALLDLDRVLYDDRTLEQARAAAAEVSTRIESCPADSGTLDIACVLDAVLENATAVPISDSSVEASTVTSVLINRRGACAALVGTVLALTERPAPLFDVVVLREHVLLGSVATGHEYFETIDGGRRLSTSDLFQYKPWPPGGPVTVNASEYPAYYADNIAVRLAETDQIDLAWRFFENAKAVSPTSARIRYNYGTFLLQHGEVAQAASELTRAIRLGWKDAPTYVNRGAARWQLGQIKAAKRDFRKALKLDPQNREATANLRRLNSGNTSRSTN